MSGRQRSRLTALLIAGSLGGNVGAMDLVRVETGTDAAVAKYGVTGRGVIVAILDRGIDWTHPDFINSDGTRESSGCST